MKAATIIFSPNGGISLIESFFLYVCLLIQIWLHMNLFTVAHICLMKICCMISFGGLLSEKLPCFKQARIFSNKTNSLIPQLSLSVQIVTDGAGNQDWSLKSGSGGLLLTLTINKKDHKISDQSLNSLPLDLEYKHHLHGSYSFPSFATTIDNKEHKSSIWFEKLSLNISCFPHFQVPIMLLLIKDDEETKSRSEV